MTAVLGVIVVLLAVFVIRPADDDAVVARDGSTTTVVEQSVQEFLEGFFAALADNDAGTLYDTLHQVVIEQCGDEAIRTYLQTLDDDTADFTLRDVSEIETFDFDPGNGNVVEVENSYSVTIDRVIRGDTVEQTVHLGVLENRLRWFTRCPS